jgi:hypothetical protein
MHCYMHKFPNAPVFRNHLTKERALGDNFVALLPEYTFTFDKRIDGDTCFPRRPDAFLDLLTHIVVIENDENQHRSYDEACENKRSMQLLVNVALRPLLVLKFNPDAYRDPSGRLIGSCFAIHKGNGAMYLKNEADYDSRLSTLFERITYHASHIPEKNFIEERLFYD